MPNRLARENSLYLRQHADNPVDWYPWGPEAFAAAQADDKPILVSIGYSSCHWCHVMAHESFEDPYIARLMNEHFICVKVDREERPDVDQIYMDAVQMLNGQGGWPLNVFCLPDGQPFAGGTYFPPDERRGHGIVPWPQLLMRVADYYARQRADLEENARAILGNLAAANRPPSVESGGTLDGGEFLAVCQALVEHADRLHGGFGEAPKFPPSMNLDFLLAMRNSATVELGHPELAAEIDTVLTRTLEAMAHGGLYDQVGGGFARYCVDREWRIPHFEKMLYDNALLLGTYSRAFQRYGNPLYREVVRETIIWLEREMADPSGAFHASLDADVEGEEGLTYLWRPGEVLDILGRETGERFCKAYGITPEGNFENSGRSHPAFLADDPELRASLEPARRALLEARSQRPQPGKDPKCLTAWNALLARGLAQAAFTFGNPAWMEKATAIGHWIWNTMQVEPGRLASVAYGSEVSGVGNLDDYAFSAEAFLAIAAVVDYAQPGQSPEWVARAQRLLETVRTVFHDPDEPGYFFTAGADPHLVHRKKDWFDGSIPSAMSSLVHAFSAMEMLTGQAGYAEETERLRPPWGGIIRTAPSAAGHALAGFVQQATGVAHLKYRTGAPLESLRQHLVERPWRPLYSSPDPDGTLSAAFQLCVGTQCLEPTDSVQTVAGAL